MTQPTALPTPADTAQTLAPYQSAAAELLGQAERAEISNAETAGMAGDLVKIISARLKGLDEQRQALVRPLNDHVKWINDQFKPHKATLTQAKELVNTKLTAFLRAEEARQREAAAAARAAAEEEALARAEALEAEGDKATAAAVVDAAAALPEAPAKAGPTARGAYGAAVGGRRTWKFDLCDFTQIPQQFLRAPAYREESVRAGRVPLLELDIAAVKEAIEAAVAAGQAEAQIATLIPGLRLYKALAAAVR